MRVALLLASFALLGCQAGAAAGDRIACAPEGEPLTPICTLSRMGEELIVHQPAGGFRRLILTTDGLASADGAESVVLARGDGGVDATIGGWTYRIPTATR